MESLIYEKRKTQDGLKIVSDGTTSGSIPNGMRPN